MEVRLDGSTRTIVVPMDHDLLVNMEDVVPSLGPLCSNMEGTTLATSNDVGLVLRVSFLIFLVYVPCIFLSHLFLD